MTETGKTVPVYFALVSIVDCRTSPILNVKDAPNKTLADKELTLIK